MLTEARHLILKVTASFNAASTEIESLFGSSSISKDIPFRPIRHRTNNVTQDLGGTSHAANPILAAFRLWRRTNLGYGCAKLGDQYGLPGLANSFEDGEALCLEFGDGDFLH